MKSGRHRLVLSVVLCALALVIFLWFAKRYFNDHTPRVRTQQETNQSNNQSKPSLSPHGAQPQLQAFAVVLNGLNGGDASRRTLAELKTLLLSLPQGEALTVIREFLDTGTDAKTHQGFTIGNDGFLVSAPSLRVFLLDLLGQIDPLAAAAYARIVLERMDSPDEWAVCLRNVARASPTPESRSYLQQRFSMLLQQGAWQGNPSVGFLEAFDLAVFLGGAEFIPALSHLVRNEENPTAAHAAFLALDRLTLNEPTTVLRMFIDRPDLLDGREAIQAGYFARADVRDPTQRELLERYLLASNRSAQELIAFAELFPNANLMVSHNLLTRTVTFSNEDLRQKDQATIATINSWLNDPKFNHLVGVLKRLQERLNSYYH